MTIDLGKSYRTRDGREVRIYAVDGGGDYPVHGAYLCRAEWRVETWDDKGFCTDPDHEDNIDLVEVRPRIKREVWVNVYPGGIVNVRYSRNDADDDATSDRIACVRVEIDVEEGHGL